MIFLGILYPPFDCHRSDKLFRLCLFTLNTSGMRVSPQFLQGCLLTTIPIDSNGGSNGKVRNQLYFRHTHLN